MIRLQLLKLNNNNKPIMDIVHSQVHQINPIKYITKFIYLGSIHQDQRGD